MAAATKFSPSGAMNSSASVHLRRRISRPAPIVQSSSVPLLAPWAPPTGYASKSLAWVFTSQTTNSSGDS